MKINSVNPAFGAKVCCYSGIGDLIESKYDGKRDHTYKTPYFDEQKREFMHRYELSDLNYYKLRNYLFKRGLVTDRDDSYSNFMVVEKPKLSEEEIIKREKVVQETLDTAKENAKAAIDKSFEKINVGAIIDKTA